MVENDFFYTAEPQLSGLQYNYAGQNRIILFAVIQHSSPDSQPNFCLLSSVQLGKGGAVKHKVSLYFYLPLYENSIYEYFCLQIIFAQKMVMDIVKKSIKKPFFFLFFIVM